MAEAYVLVAGSSTFGPPGPIIIRSTSFANGDEAISVMPIVNAPFSFALLITFMTPSDFPEWEWKKIAVFLSIFSFL